jgi:hypothetical protein
LRRNGILASVAASDLACCCNLGLPGAAPKGDEQLDMPKVISIPKLNPEDRVVAIIKDALRDAGEQQQSGRSKEKDK